MVIKTNNVPRHVILDHELTEDERKEFDIDGSGEYVSSFVRYKGGLYNIDEFQSTSAYGSELEEFRNAGWDGYIHDTFFSGILLKWVSGTDMEEVIMGRYYT